MVKWNSNIKEREADRTAQVVQVFVLNTARKRGRKEKITVPDAAKEKQ
jgi:hypothetical protein